MASRHARNPRKGRASRLSTFPPVESYGILLRSGSNGQGVRQVDLVRRARRRVRFSSSRRLPSRANQGRLSRPPAGVLGPRGRSRGGPRGCTAHSGQGVCRAAGASRLRRESRQDRVLGCPRRGLRKLGRALRCHGGCRHRSHRRHGASGPFARMGGGTRVGARIPRNPLGNRHRPFPSAGPDRFFPEAAGASAWERVESALWVVVGALPRSTSTGALVRGVGERMRSGDPAVRGSLSMLGGMAARARELLRDKSARDEEPTASGIGRLADEAMRGLAALGLSNPSLEVLLEEGRRSGARGES